MKITKNDFKFITDKFDYTSPVIMVYFTICLIMLILDQRYGGINEKYLMLPGTKIPFPYPGWQLLTHIVAHRDASHFVGNMSLILLTGPEVEKKYGSFETMTMILTEAVAHGILNGLFFKTALMGASGIAYMMICLNAMSRIKDHKIPVASVMVMLMYLGTEIINSIMSQSDDISQFGHLLGGVIGIAFGVYCSRNGIIGENAEHITLENMRKQREQYQEFLVRTGRIKETDKKRLRYNMKTYEEFTNYQKNASTNNIEGGEHKDNSE